jgi:hypothetical protein
MVSGAAGAKAHRPHPRPFKAPLAQRQRLLIREASVLRGLVGLPPVRAGEAAERGEGREREVGRRRWPEAAGRDGAGQRIVVLECALANEGRA